MHPRLYRLTELHQRIDDALRNRRRDPTEFTRLMRLKLRVKQLTRRVLLKSGRRIARA
ncbi:MAG TPA: hypothetical protein VD768_07350 [Sphingomicrobium sp.]|nr:hypothetical protein [Sphingomicrobium sp.]